MHCLSKAWFRMLNKNHEFIRQITIKEMRARFYRTMRQRLVQGLIAPTPDARNVHQETTSKPHPPNTSESEDTSLGDPSNQYQMAKTHTSYQNLGEWLHRNREDPALHVSPRIARNV
jgi:hypothetical protein